MEHINSYIVIIGTSLLVILSYLFNILARKTGTPSVLLLILTGIIINIILKITGIELNNLNTLIEVLGIVGLILIVLEASLDLNLKKEKWSIIWKSFTLALLSITLTVPLISLIISLFTKINFFHSLLYAIPLSILSSAIIIPSVSNLPHQKREFMTYESIFGDILGIMIFYFVLEGLEVTSLGELGFSIFTNIFITIFASVLICYGLIFLFQNITTEVKFFLLIAVLVLLFSIAKLLHLSSLLIILTFGIMLENRHIFFRGILIKFLREKKIQDIFFHFKTVTIESSFIIRTFFFVMFGLSLTLASILNFKVFLISTFALGAIYGFRYILTRLFLGRNIFPELWLAPRGLITILLFFSIPEQYQSLEFDPGILLLVLITSNIIMAVFLVRYKKRSLLIRDNFLEDTPSRAIIFDQSNPEDSDSE